MTRPACVACGKRTNEKNFEERESMCATCFRRSKLEPFDRDKARRLIKTLQEGTYFKPNGALVGGKNLEQCGAQLRRIMLPPPGREWDMALAAEVWASGLNWPESIGQVPDTPPAYHAGAYHSIPLRDEATGELICRWCRLCDDLLEAA